MPKLIIGIDIGGTKVAGGLVNLIFEDARAWAYGRAPYDDQTVVVVKAL